MASMEISANANKLLNTYFITPVISINSSIVRLNTSVRNLNTSVSNINNYVSLLNNDSIEAVNLLNELFIKPVTDISNNMLTDYNLLDSAITNTNLSITRLNTSVIANTLSITDINSSISQMRSTASTLNTSVSNLSNYVINLNTLVNVSFTDVNSSITQIKTTSSTLNTTVSNLSVYVTNLNTSVNVSFTDVNSSITQIKTTASSLNTTVSNLSVYVTNFNSSMNISILEINTSISLIKTTASNLNTTVSNLSNYVTNLNTLVNSSITDINSSISVIKTTALTLNTSVSNISNYVTNINTSLNNAIDSVSSTTLSIGGTNGTSSQSYAGSLTSGTLNIASAITTGNINIGNTTGSNIFIGNSSVANIFIGGFKFLAKTISGITTGILNLFTDFNGTNVNLFTGMTSGTLAIGTSTNTNVVGNLNLIANSIYPKTSNIMSVGGTNTTTLNLGSGSGTIVNVGNLGAVTSIKGGYSQIALNDSNSTITPIPSYLEVGSGAPNNYLDFHCGGSGSSVDYDARIICTASNSTTSETGSLKIQAGSIELVGTTNITGTTNINGITNIAVSNQGYTHAGYTQIQQSGVNTILNFQSANNNSNGASNSQIHSYGGDSWFGVRKALNQFWNGQEEHLFGMSMLPRSLGDYNALGFGYYDGGGTIENATTISGFGPYGGVRFGGAGLSNSFFGNSWRQSMCVYPGYGTRFFNGGISFDRGQLTSSVGSGRGSFYQSGLAAFNTNIPGNGALQFTVNYPVAFSSIPVASVIVISGGDPAGNATNCLIATVYDYSPGLFRCWIKNTVGVATGTNGWAIYFNVWGSY